jgi:hypothetical protein
MVKSRNNDNEKSNHGEKSNITMMKSQIMVKSRNNDTSKPRLRYIKKYKEIRMKSTYNRLSQTRPRIVEYFTIVGTLAFCSIVCREAFIWLTTMSKAITLSEVAHPMLESSADTIKKTWTVDMFCKTSVNKLQSHRIWWQHFVLNIATTEELPKTTMEPQVGIELMNPGRKG